MKTNSLKIICPNSPAASVICWIAIVFISSILANTSNAGSLDQAVDLKLCITNSQKRMVAIQWSASAGSSYQLQWNNNLSSPVWASLPSLMATTDGKMVVDRETAALPQCFYRVAQVGATISGLVRDANGPVAGAIVRIQATRLSTNTDASGRFCLSGLTPNLAVPVTAWASGYFNAGGTAFKPGQTGIEIILPRHANQDNPDYEWTSSFTTADSASNCQNCHGDPADSRSALPFDEWRRDAHSQSVTNIRFLTMYAGTDVSGHASPATRYGFNPDYGRIPLRPDPTQPYYGPGYKLDFPDTAGNCAACHAPAAAVNAAYEVDVRNVSGVGQESVACDFCHKVWDVKLDPQTGLPFPARPGVLSYEFRRPFAGHQFFAGPFDDVAPFEDTFSPLQKQSQLCAPCHFGVFWSTSIYNSFGEWQASPYSDPMVGKSCQACHMPPGLTDHFARLDKGGLRRDPATIFSHRMPGAADETLLKNAVTLQTTAHEEGNQVIVGVTITNDKTGHHVPTDSPLRHLILWVQCTDGSGQPLVQQDGPKLPDWCGKGDPLQGCYADLPGKAFAKILEELWTEVSPTGAYWNPTRLVSDNRLAAFATDESQYSFALPIGSEIRVKVKLLYRRALKSLMDQKGWQVPDIVMAQEEMILQRND